MFHHSRRILKSVVTAALSSCVLLGDSAARSDEPASIYTIRDPNLFFHDVNEIELMATNIGRFGNGQLGLDGPSLEWRGGEYLYMGALWIGAIAPDGVPRVSTGGYDFELLPSLDPVDTIYTSFQGAPGADRNGYSADPDDDGDGRIDEEFHNGKDDDGDGRIDEDLAGVSEQMYSCEYWDWTPESQQLNPDHVPMDLFVQQQSYAFVHPNYDQFVGIDYEVRNDGDETLTDVFVGLMVDSDVGPADANGYWEDDGGSTLFTEVVLEDAARGPCSTRSRNLEMAYMYDVPDALGGADGGDVGGFLGLLYLGSTTDLTGRWAPAEAGFHSAIVYPNYAEPEGDEARYNAMGSGTVSDLPEDIADYRMLVTVGPFPSLAPGQSVTFSVAYVVGEGYFDLESSRPRPDLDNDGEVSEESLLAQATRALEAYEGRWRDLDRNPKTGVKGRETCVETELGDPFLWIAPCAASGFFYFDGTDCEYPSAWVDADCDPCTPNPEHEGCEDGGCEAQARWYVPMSPRDGDFALSGGVHPRLNRVKDLETSWGSAHRLSLRALRGMAGTIDFLIDVDAAADLELQIFDASGRSVSERMALRVERGTTEWSWSTDQVEAAVSSGIYFARLSGRGLEATTQFVLLD